MSLRQIVITAALFLSIPFAAACGGSEPDPVEEPPQCSEEDPDGVCADEETCYRGVCRSDSLFCSDERPSGLCEYAGDVCLDGVCVDSDDVCSTDNPQGLCPVGLQCRNGTCATDAPCAPDEPQGYCDAGEQCVEGSCVDIDDTCSADNPDGVCPEDEQCDAGVCVPEGQTDQCSADNPDGQCPDGQSCEDGVCVEEQDEQCSADNPDGVCPDGEICDAGVCVDDAPTVCDCMADEVCIDEQCRDEDLSCSATNPTGLCESGYDCVEGTCISSGAECSTSNPAGICPIGEWCDDGICEDIDGVGLCSDANSCTQNWFDPSLNRCTSAPVADSCTDGNGCTANWCEDGQCMSDPIDDCVEPPQIDPWTSPTNVGTLQLSGTKPAGSAIEIDGATAVSESPDTSWSVSLNLDPGENIYEVLSREGSTVSEIQEVVVVYDDIAPTTSLTPDGGSFLNGITVQVTTDEPATVYYTTDGSTPDEWSSSFQSVREFRIFEPTRLKFLAQDPAGNWEEEVVEASFEITSYANQWSAGPDLDDSLINAGVAEFDDTVYVAGGSSGTSSQAGVRGYDLDDQDWTVFPSLPNGRAQLAMVVLDSQLYAVGGEDNGTSLNHLTRLDPEVDTDWENLQAMPTTRHGLSAVAYGGEIYAFGGKSGGGTVRDTLEVYDPDSDTWTNQVAQMPRERYAFDTVLYQNQIYLFGGEDGAGEPIAEVDVYDPVDDSWSQVAPMPTPRSFLGAGVMRKQNLIDGSNFVGAVVAGGRVAGGAATAIVEEYSFEEDLWRERTVLDAARQSMSAVNIAHPDPLNQQERQIWLVGGQLASGPTDDIVSYTHDLTYRRHLEAMPDGRFSHASAIVNDRIYFFGGLNQGDQQSGWAFDPETESYNPIPDLPSIQNGLVAEAVGERIYAIGGSDQFGNPVTTVHSFDPVTWQWSSESSMPSGREDAASVVVDDEIYVIGGENNGAVQSVEIYTPSQDFWRSGPVLPDARTGAMAVVHDGDIYVLGGVDGSGDPVTSVLRLPYGQNSWEVVSNISLDAAYATATRVGQDTIAVFGGRVSGDLVGRIWFYDVAAGQEASTHLSTPLLEFDRSALSYHHGQVYLFGGNAADDPGPQGQATVQKINLHGCAPATTAFAFQGCTEAFSYDFSTGVFPDEFDTGGNADWFVTSSTSSVGGYSLQAGSIGHSQITWVEVEAYVPVPATLAFDWRVSSENNFDFLIFCADSSNCTRSSNTARISGTHSWTTYEHDVDQPGFHTFRWAYAKDGSVNNNQDTGWIDVIRIQP